MSVFADRQASPSVCVCCRTSARRRCIDPDVPPTLATPDMLIAPGCVCGGCNAERKLGKRVHQEDSCAHGYVATSLASAALHFSLRTASQRCAHVAHCAGCHRRLFRIMAVFAPASSAHVREHMSPGSLARAGGPGSRGAAPPSGPGVTERPSGRSPWRETIVAALTGPSAFHVARSRRLLPGNGFAHSRTSKRHNGRKHMLQEARKRPRVGHKWAKAHQT